MTLCDVIRWCADDYYRWHEMDSYRMWGRVCSAYERLFGDEFIPIIDDGTEI